MNEIKGIKNSKYDLNGNIYFEDSNGKSYKIHAKDVLEIAYALFDSVGHTYEELDEIGEELI